MLARIELCRSCARLCSMAVDELGLGSAYLVQICGLCAVVCRACAEECSEHAAAHYRACATACLRAAAACHAVATGSGAAAPA
ncbi:MAG: ferredoxin [Lacunisphaera sp.]|nr:ferredoxin [Lacunisphaera sp.]